MMWGSAQDRVRNIYPQIAFQPYKTQEDHYCPSSFLKQKHCIYMVYCLLMFFCPFPSKHHTIFLFVWGSFRCCWQFFCLFFCLAGFFLVGVLCNIRRSEFSPGSVFPLTAWRSQHNCTVNLRKPKVREAESNILRLFVKAKSTRTMPT